MRRPDPVEHAKKAVARKIETKRQEARASAPADSGTLDQGFDDRRRVPKEVYAFIDRAQGDKAKLDALDNQPVKSVNNYITQIPNIDGRPVTRGENVPLETAVGYAARSSGVDATEAMDEIGSQFKNDFELAAERALGAQMVSASTRNVRRESGLALVDTTLRMVKEGDVDGLRTVANYLGIEPEDLVRRVVTEKVEVPVPSQSWWEQKPEIPVADALPNWAWALGASAGGTAAAVAAANTLAQLGQQQIDPAAYQQALLASKAYP